MKEKAETENQIRSAKVSGIGITGFRFFKINIHLFKETRMENIIEKEIIKMFSQI